MRSGNIFLMNMVISQITNVHQQKQPFIFLPALGKDWENFHKSISTEAQEMKTEELYASSYSVDESRLQRRLQHVSQLHKVRSCLRCNPMHRPLATRLSVIAILDVTTIRRTILLGARPPVTAIHISFSFTWRLKLALPWTDASRHFLHPFPLETSAQDNPA
jgi:hypothetical protein